MILSLIGAGIEVVRGLSIVARDRDFWDWVADNLAIAAGLGPMLLVPWRGACTEPLRSARSLGALLRA